jgi:hypothetical protein
MKSHRSKSAYSRKGGFLLLESMIAVFMFAVGLIALGHCVRNLMRAERFKREDAKARQVLANYFSLIENGGVSGAESFSEEVGDGYEGMKIHYEKEQLKLQNEREEEVFGLFQIKLAVTWESDREELRRELSFIMYPRNNMKGFSTAP